MVAVRDDRFCLSRLVVEARGEEPRNEWLSVLEVDERGDEQRAADFGPDALGEAIAEPDSWWLDALDPDDRLAAETELRLQTALHPVDLDEVAELLHPEFRFRDHQRLSIFGELAREEWLEAVADRGAVGRDTSLVREAKMLAPDVVLLVQQTVGASADGVEWERQGIAIAHVVDGLVRNAHVFEIADRAAALELAQQLAGRRSRRG